MGWTFLCLIWIALELPLKTILFLIACLSLSAKYLLSDNWFCRKWKAMTSTTQIGSETHNSEPGRFHTDPFLCPPKVQLCQYGLHSVITALLVQLGKFPIGAVMLQNLAVCFLGWQNFLVLRVTSPGCPLFKRVYVIRRPKGKAPMYPVKQQGSQGAGLNFKRTY